MPRKTTKEKIIEKVYFDACCRLVDLDTSDESEAETIEVEVHRDVAVLEKFRYGDINPVPKQLVWLSDVLPEYNEGRFKEVTRLTYDQFHKVFLTLKDNDVFHSAYGHKSQIPVGIQLVVVLHRFGTYGNGASVSNIAKLFGISDGSSITRMTRRVIKALADVEQRFIYWPDERERADSLVAETANYLPQCIGWADGVKIELDEAPSVDSEAYFDGKKDYSLNTQLVCDYKKMIRQYVIGYPGSCHDSRIWNECNLSKTPERFFSDEQWVAGDKGYPLRKNLITPMKESYNKVNPIDKKKYNKYFSKYRVIIEHVNGVLKETFESLKGLRVKINDSAGHEAAVNWIRSCLILYNITQPFDNWTPPDTDYSSDEEEEEQTDATGDDFTAEDKRLALMNYILSKGDSK